MCYTAQECKDLHGEGKGSCASGFGTCCVFLYNGADRNRKEVLGRKISYIENPSKSSRSLMQMLEIKATNKGVIHLERFKKINELIWIPVPPCPKFRDVFYMNTSEGYQSDQAGYGEL